MWIIRKGLSEYPLKRIWIFKGLSVRPSIGYPSDLIRSCRESKQSDRQAM